MVIATLLPMSMDMIPIIEATFIPRADITGGKVWKNFKSLPENHEKQT